MRPAATLPVLPFLFASCVIVEGGPEPRVTPQRPTLSSDAATTEPGVLALEAGVALDPGDAFALDGTLRHGLDERTEVFLGWTPYATVDRPGDDGEGQGDLVLGARRRVYEPSPDMALALQTRTKLPTGDEDEGLSSGEVDFFLAGILTHAARGAPEITGFYELGVVGDPRRPDTELSHLVAGAVTVPLENDLSVFGELSHLSAGFGPDPLLAIVGIAQRRRPGLVLDAGIALGLNDDAPDVAFLVGLTTALGRVAPAAGHAQ